MRVSRLGGKMHVNMKRRILAVFGGLLLVLYIASYVILSRRGYSEADKYNIKGFYYVFPENTAAWRAKNYGCAAFFWPLNIVDRAIGLGRYPASEPLWGLSK